MQCPRWLVSGTGLLVLALGVFAMPSHLEGPVLVAVSPGHAIAVADAVAAVLLVGASLILYLGLWRGRAELGALATRHPGRAIGLGSASGLGLGLLLASAFSAFFWWWAIGAVLFAITVAAASVFLVRAQPPD